MPEFNITIARKIPFPGFFFGGRGVGVGDVLFFPPSPTPVVYSDIAGMGNGVTRDAVRHISLSLVGHQTVTMMVVVVYQLSTFKHFNILAMS